MMADVLSAHVNEDILGVMLSLMTAEEIVEMMDEAREFAPEAVDENYQMAWDNYLRDLRQNVVMDEEAHGDHAQKVQEIKQKLRV